MRLSFDISELEADSIAEYNGYTIESNNRDEFLLEVFKQFARNCIVSQEERKAFTILDAAKKQAIASAKSSISF